MNWPFLAGMGAADLVRETTKLFINHVHVSAAIDIVLVIVGILVIPIGLFLAGICWWSIRLLDLAPRIGLVVRGARRSDSETPIPR